MKEEIFNCVKVLSYFLWEYTKHDNTLQLWCCSEDIICFLAENDIKTKNDFMRIISLGKKDEVYKKFVRNIAYKIFEYTDEKSNDKNWFAAEKFIRNSECIDACIRAVRIFGKVMKNDEIYKSIRSENAKGYICDKNLN